MPKRLYLFAAIALHLATGWTNAAAEGYPTKPVTIVVPYAPGGTTDIVARVVAEQLTLATGQTFIVENRSGASGTVAMGYVAKSAPDGYTLLANEVTQTVMKALFARLPFDPERDLQPVMLIAESPVVLGVTRGLPVSSLRELIAYGKSHPGKLNFGSGGAGSGPHIAGELLKQVAGIDIVHVPYKGSGPAVTDLIGGQIDLLASAAPTIAPHVNSDKIKAVAVAGPARVPQLANVPTSAEAGLPAFQFSIWFGLTSPKGTPAAVVERLNSELKRILAKPDVREKLAAAGANIVGAGPGPFAQRISAETTQWTALLVKAGVKPE